MDSYNIFIKIIENSHIITELRNHRYYYLPKKEFETMIQISQKEKKEDVINEINEILLKKPLVIDFGWKNSEQPFMIKIEYKQYQNNYYFQILPTWNEIKDASALMNSAVTEEISRRFRELTQPQSEIFIENVLSDPKLKWIKNFKLSPTRIDDEGIDFTALLLIHENKKDIGFQGFGKMVDIVGQLKHHKNQIQPEKIREFIGTIETSRKKFGIFISTNGYTQKAISQSEKSKYPIFCWDATYIAKIMVKYKIGIKSITIKKGLIQNNDWWHEIHNTA